MFPSEGGDGEVSRDGAVVVVVQGQPGLRECRTFFGREDVGVMGFGFHRGW
ncbi:MAG: hypothetical protein V9F00_04610 [Nocardioides sp.]